MEKGKTIRKAGMAKGEIGESKKLLKNSGETKGTVNEGFSDKPGAKEKWAALASKDIRRESQADTAKSNAANGKKRESVTLTVPGQVIETGESGESQSLNPAGSRRESRMSIVSAVDLFKLQNTTQETESDEKKNFTPRNDPYIRTAIPYLPLWLAVVCLMLNFVMPGIGTILSGCSIFCCGKPRVQAKDGHMATTFCVNVMVGLSQLFTVTFMLVGWFWSFVWGIYLVILAVEMRREDKKHKEKELQALALTALSSQVRPWTLKT